MRRGVFLLPGSARPTMLGLICRSEPPRRTRFIIGEHDTLKEGSGRATMLHRRGASFAALNTPFSSLAEAGAKKRRKKKKVAKAVDTPEQGAAS